MAQTRPTGEQLRFRSENTGDHILDTYMEASEKGGRALFDLLDDIFESDTGNFAADNFQFRFNEATNELEVRVGVFSGQDTGYKNITPFFAQRGTFSANTNYKNLDTVVTSTKDVYVVHGLAKDSTLSFNDEASFISSSNTQRIVDVSEARDWASKTDGQVDSTDYSAKAYAIGGQGVDDTIGSAKDWAIKTNATVDGTNYSAKYWATDPNVTTVSTNINDITTVSDDIANVNIAAADIANINTAAGDITNINSVAAELGAGKDVTIVASDLEGTDTIGTVALDIANVNTTAGSIGNVNTAATDISNINTVATNISDVNTVSPFVGTGNDITVVAAEINNNNLQTVANDIQDVIDVANDLNEANSDIEIVAGAIDNVDTVGQNIIDVNTVAGIDADVTTVAGINTDVTNVSGISTDVTTVSGISANVTTTANNDANITTVAQNITNVDTTAADINSVNTVATDISNVNTTATNIGDVNTTASNIASVNTVAGIDANVTTVAGINTEVTTVANINTDVSTVAGISTNVTTVANNDANVTTVANNDANITTVANNDTNVTTVANNIGDVNTVANISSDVTTAAQNTEDFNDRYLGPKSSEPSTDNDGDALQPGALYFDTTLDELRVYDGSQWLSTNYNSANVNITGGTISGTDVDVSGATFTVADDQITGDAINGGTATPTTVNTTNLNVDSGTLFVDSANNRVGIGTSSPSADLSFGQASNLNFHNENGDTSSINVVDGGNYLRAKIEFPSGPNNQDTDINFYTETGKFSADALALKIGRDRDISFYEDTGTTPKFFWDASAERLGIGTSSPEADIEILQTAGSPNTSGGLWITASDDIVYPGIYIQDESGNASQIRIRRGGLNENGRLQIRSDDGILFEPNNSESARIDSSGNVGIGKSFPGAKLDVNGTANATNLTRDGSQVYSRDNILGTVSESGGVPTGAIIERGSNSNGEYVKFADGTMFCTHETESLVLNASYTFDTPVSFIQQPAVSFQQSGSTTSAGSVNKPFSGAMWRAVGGGKVRIRFVLDTSTASRPARYMAWGFWK